MNASRRRLGASWARLRGVLGPSWGVLGHLGVSSDVLVFLKGVLGTSWGRLEGILEASWGRLGMLGGRLGSIMGHLGVAWSVFGAAWGRLDEKR